MLSELDSAGRCKLVGRLGEFRLKGPRVSFEQGPSLRELLDGAPLAERGLACDIFSALVSWPPWTGIEVPGLFCAWVRQDRRGEARDYLGRPMYFGQEGLGLTVRTTVRLPSSEDDG